MSVMSVMSIRIDERKRKVLKIIASIEGKTMSGIVSELIEQYVNQQTDAMKDRAAKKYLTNIMKMSEKSFMEWDNEEDEIYNTL